MDSRVALNLTTADVLRVLHVSDQSVRAHDWSYAQARLSLTDVLGRFDDPSLAANYHDVAAPAAAMAAFIARSQRGPNPDYWLWCIQNLRRAGLDAIEIANAAVIRSRPEVSGCNDVPVASISLFPGSYRLVPLSEVPYGHAPGRCKYEPYRSGNPEHAKTETRLRSQHRRRIRNRFNQSPQPDFFVAAWKDIQERIQVGQLPPCSLHAPSINWNLIQTAAVDILARTPHTVRNGVKKWDLAVADTFIHEEALAYPWPTDNNSDPHRMSVVLRSLFREPITWQPGNPCVENGQHRICGLRETGTTHAFLVDTTLHAQLETTHDSPLGVLD